MNIIRNITTKTSIKCPYKMTPEFIVVHNTANDASARNEIAYMNSNNKFTSFHYAVDDKEIVQGIEENRNSFNSGDGARGDGNRKGISIEICYSKSGGDRFIKAEQNAVELIVDILKRYNWGVDKVRKHQDFAPNKKYCPHRTLDLGWDRFIQMINLKLYKPEIKPIVDKQKGYTGGSIIDYLISVKINSSFSNRRNLAVRHGVVKYAVQYLGTAKQNAELLKRMRGF